MTIHLVRIHPFLVRLAICLAAVFMLLSGNVETALARPVALEPDPRIQALIDQVTPQLVNQTVDLISGEVPVTVGGVEYTLTNRTNASQSIQHAVDYLYEQFTASGLEASYHIWNQVQNYRSVLADQDGVGPGVYLLTSHIDVFGAAPAAYGADDNASGVAGVLIASQTLSQVDFRDSIRYLAFSGEEAGLLGSHAYATLMDAQDADIRGVINLDMIAYNTAGSPNSSDLHIRQDNPGDLALASLYSQVIAAYNIPLETSIQEDNESRSDHFSFWEHGYSAVFASEDFDDMSPYYHTGGDRSSTLDSVYASSQIKAAVAVLAHLAGMIDRKALYLPVVIR